MFSKAINLSLVTSTPTLYLPHGLKYILDGRIGTPSGKTPVVRSVWIVDAGREAPRLVTAYPKPEQASL
jgi:hypothetical protein